MSFASPAFLLALLLVPISVALYLRSERRRQRAELAFASPETMPSVVPARPGWRRHAPMAAYVVALIALTLALARPEATVAVPDGRAATMLVTDKSASMAATDVAPSRLGAAKRAAGDFLDEVPDEVKVGSVAYNNHIRGIESPTDDREVVRAAIARLRPGGGTATGDALSAAVRTLERVRGTARGARERSPAAIVLLSDGFSTHGRSPLDAAEEAKERGVRVYTVALGTDEGQIEVPTGAGLEVRPVPPDPDSLEQIASLTGGRAFAAADQLALGAVYEELVERVGTKEEKREITAGFAAGAALLLAAGGLMSLRWFGRLP